QGHRAGERLRHRDRLRPPADHQQLRVGPDPALRAAGPGRGRGAARRSRRPRHADRHPLEHGSHAGRRRGDRAPLEDDRGPRDQLASLGPPAALRSRGRRGVRRRRRAGARAARRGGAARAAREPGPRARGAAREVRREVGRVPPARLDRRVELDAAAQRPRCRRPARTARAAARGLAAGGRGGSEQGLKPAAPSAIIETRFNPVEPEPAPACPPASMKLDFTAEQRALRKEIRSYYRELLTPEVRAAFDAEREEMGGPLYRQLVGRMGSDGWLGIGWPREEGGQGGGPIEQFIFWDETYRARAPLPVIMVNTIGPTLMRFGSEAQKRELLPKILRGELHFAIGYTEPGSGTDLASLTTRAVQDGEHWVINGQKIFTTHAHDADVIWLAA